ncbi:MAG TPA: universal stress protein [Solirubrobacteraceae bacterium]|jgi:nucleotide-binding universal stress UspA family protein
MSAHIIVGVDGSDDSINAYRWALDEAKVRNAEVTAIFAWELPMIGIPGAFDRDELEAEGMKFLNDQLGGQPNGNGVTVHRVVAQGDPSTSLIEACRRTDAEMLVLGSRGRGGFGGLLLGSVGQECASHAPCPVLICRAGGETPSS